MKSHYLQGFIQPSKQAGWPWALGVSEASGNDSPFPPPVSGGRLQAVAVGGSLRWDVMDSEDETGGYVIICDSKRNMGRNIGRREGWKG